MAGISSIDRSALLPPFTLRGAPPEAARESADGEERLAAGPRKPTGEPLSDAERRQLDELQRRDREVRAHEAAHKAAAGGLAAGSPQFETVRGPDGRSYAVGGEVRISSRSGGNPLARLRQAEQVQRAALAPADPSTTDRQVAARAAADAAAARRELASEENRPEEAGTAETREPRPEPGTLVNLAV